MLHFVIIKPAHRYVPNDQYKQVKKQNAAGGAAFPKCAWKPLINSKS